MELAQEEIPADVDKSLTVKIQLDEDSENILALNYPATFNCRALKEDIARKFKISSFNFRIFYRNSEEISDECLVSDLKLNDFGIVEIKLKLTDDAVRGGVNLDTNVYYSNFNISEIITVHVLDENEQGVLTSRDIVVEIENKSIRKPFVGGYVNKKTSE
jgi:hypothetical protein